MIRSVGVFTAPRKPRAWDLARRLTALAEAHGIEIRLQRESAHEIGRDDLGLSDESRIAACDALVIFGGDGAVLHAARMAAPHGTPILAVDLGRLGFLSSVHPADLDSAFERLLGGDFEIEERMMLEARVLRSDHPFETGSDDAAPATLNLCDYTTDVGGSIGLNDAVVAKSALARILRLSIYIEGELAAETRADGLIISTPTGSTAYALSSGGPIVHPQVPLMLICPICPHSLTQRPLVIGPDETLEVLAEWEGDEVSPSQLDAMLTVDGQVGVSLRDGDVVRVRRSTYKARLLQLPESNFFHRLRDKMRWGR
jgi:NAD+ kinase